MKRYIRRLLDKSAEIAAVFAVAALPSFATTAFDVVSKGTPKAVGGGVTKAGMRRDEISIGFERLAGDFRCWCYREGRQPRDMASLVEQLRGRGK